jgi:hypothetical protein
MRKRNIIIAGILTFSLMLGGCGNNTQDTSGNNDNTQQETVEKSEESTQAVSSTEESTQAASSTETEESTEAEDSNKTEDQTTEAKATTEEVQYEEQMEYVVATKEEGVEYLMSNTEYFDGFTQNDLDYKMQKTGATKDEYLEFCGQQVVDFTDNDIEILDQAMADIEKSMAKQGIVLPKIDTIVFIKTTMNEEYGADAYTHGTQIYLGENIFSIGKSDVAGYKSFKQLVCHEIFHCLTRCNPEFRKEMYKIIGFNVQDEDFVIPPSVEEYFISNPDVEHHNAYAAFDINGKKTDCFMALITTKHFEKPGEDYFKNHDVALIPTDGSDTYYSYSEASNFYDLLGKNTEYVIDPEECMADNFAYAVCYGKLGQSGRGYESPELIDNILSYLQK